MTDQEHLSNIESLQDQLFAAHQDLSKAVKAARNEGLKVQAGMDFDLHVTNPCDGSSRRIAFDLTDGEFAFKLTISRPVTLDEED